MNFLAPLFLLGALAIAGPVIFHLIRRTTREVTPFSSLMFLKATPPRVTRRSRIENLWLLLLRCLVIALLALGFARPFLQRHNATAQPGANAGKRTVILVDTSASMRREDLAAQARAKAEAIVRDAKPEDEVALLTFDRAPHMLLTFEQWRKAAASERTAEAIQKIGTIAPGWSGTHLGAALLQAAEMLNSPAEGKSPSLEIVIVSDMQEGCRFDGLQGYEWQRGIGVRIEPVVAKRLANAAAQWIAESEEAENTDAKAGPRIRVMNSAEAHGEQFTLEWSKPGANSDKLDVYVPAGQVRVARPSPPEPGAERLALSGDEVSFDNALFILPPQPVQAPLLYVGNDANEDSSGAFYFLSRAFQKTPSLRVDVRAVRGDTPVPAFHLQQAQMIVLGDGIEDAALAGIRQYIRDGRSVLAALTNATGAQTIARLLEAPAFTATEADVKDYAMLAQIDFQHPLFSAFADPRFSDFTKIHFWKRRALDAATLPSARIVASFDDKSPAIVEVPLGKGRVIVLASTWRPADSQLALSSKFVPLLYSMLEQSSRLPPRKAQYFVGEEVPLPPGAQPLKVRKPDGTEIDIAAGETFAGTDEPGIYQVTPGPLRFAVNLAPDESKLTPFGAERLASLGVPLASAMKPAVPHSPEEAARAQAAELEGRQKMWRWLIVAALAALLIETLVAGRVSRLSQTRTEAAT